MSEAVAPGRAASVPAEAPPGRSLSVLIAALGGQGGGVLTEWIVDAARRAGFVVQATSTPGVSQRTGATTYYIEMAKASSPAPVLGIAPVPGRVDVLVCAELVEAARMLERGMSTPSRTRVVASTHRVYTTPEKASGGDARVDSARVIDAVRALALQATLVDMEAIRVRHGSVISAALFGAVAGSGALPIDRTTCEDAIRAGGRGVDASLAAFAEAFDCAARPQTDSAPATDAIPDTTFAVAPVSVPFTTRDGRPVASTIVRALAALPDDVADAARAGAAELIDFQDDRYAAMYLDRIARVVIAEQRAGAATYAVAHEAARQLARAMRYDDMIRVASRKARRSRLARIRAEADVQDGALVHVDDLFCPSTLELAAILPRRLGAWLERRALRAQAGKRSGTGLAMPGRSVRLRTSSVIGALALRSIALLRPLRPHSLRFAREQHTVEDWLVALELALTHDRVTGGSAALEVARLPRLIRGYGTTHEVGWTHYRRILDAYRRTAATDAVRAAADLRESARVAFSDPRCGRPETPQAGVAARPAAASSPA